MNKTNLKKAVGNYGETVAVKYLKDKGHEVLDRNYVNKIGELDIVSKKDNGYHFVEVKTIFSDLGQIEIKGEGITPEDHIDAKKVRKVLKVSSLYAIEKKIDQDADISVDAVLVRLFGSSREEHGVFPTNVRKIVVTYIKDINVL
jgi:putative endonuclease